MILLSVSYMGITVSLQLMIFFYNKGCVRRKMYSTVLPLSHCCRCRVYIPIFRFHGNRSDGISPHSDTTNKSALSTYHFRFVDSFVVIFEATALLTAQPYTFSRHQMVRGASNSPLRIVLYSKRINDRKQRSSSVAKVSSDACVGLARLEASEEPAPALVVHWLERRSRNHVRFDIYLFRSYFLFNY